MSNRTNGTVSAPDTPVSEEMQALMAELEAVKAEASKAKAEAEHDKAELDKNANESGDTEPATHPSDDGEELIEIKLFKDSKDYKDDLTVGVNGRFIKIKRGVPVKVKKKYARVIEQSNIQDAATAELIERKTAEYRAESEKYE